MSTAYKHHLATLGLAPLLLLQGLHGRRRMDKVIVRVRQQDDAPHICHGCMYRHDPAGCGKAPDCYTDGYDAIFVEGELLHDIVEGSLK